MSKRGRNGKLVDKILEKKNYKFQDYTTKMLLRKIIIGVCTNNLSMHLILADGYSGKLSLLLF